MKVELIKPVAGLAYFEGDVIELSDARARALIESGHAVQAADTITPPAKEAPAETAASQAPLSAETAAVTIGKKKKS